MYMSKKKERLEFINMELAHERFHDGWVVQGLLKEKKELEKCLNLEKGQKKG